MSKFLKFIVNLILICAILVAAALLIPPFTGLEMVMNDNTSKETNLPVGSVAYGRGVEVSELDKGDKIIYSNGDQGYVYKIIDMDSTAGIYKVEDVYDKNAEETSVQLVNDAVKTIVVVPYIAYGAIALQSKEGLIVIGLGVIFLIILFILAELWRRDDDDEEDEEDEDDDEEEDEEDEEDEDEELSRKERKQRKKEEKLRKKEEKRRAKLEKKGLLDEEEEEEPVRAKTAEEKQPDIYDSVMQDTMASLAESIAQTQDEKKSKNSEEDDFGKTINLASLSDGRAGSEKSAETQEIFAGNPEETEEKTKDKGYAADYIEEIEERQMETVEQMPARNKDAVLPAPSVMELLSKAEAAGESPEIIKDEENDITLLDYSDLL